MSAEDRRTWAYGPLGEAQEFACPEDVPHGWKDHPWCAADEVRATATDNIGENIVSVAVDEPEDHDEGDNAQQAPKRRGRPPKVR